MKKLIEKALSKASSRLNVLCEDHEIVSFNQLQGKDVMATLPDRHWQKHDFYRVCARQTRIVIYENQYH